MQINVSNRVSTLKPSAIREIFKSLTDPTVISFAAGNPSPESFPVDAMQKFANDIFEKIECKNCQIKNRINISNNLYMLGKKQQALNILKELEKEW